MVDLEQKISDLPDKSGVYIMQDAGGNIIYIGKARSLKNRVKQYFSNSAKPEKVMAMVSKARDFRYIITKTEMDALCLEANLIKKHKPQYNILLKDDKAYPYIKINLNAEYPKIEIIRKLKNDGAKYFGPFVGVSVKDLARLISEVYPLRTCNYNFNKPKKNHRPCLNYDIKLCLAPCAGRTDKATYAAVVQRLIKFLNGFDEYAKNILNDKMLTASQNEDFENAIAYREKLQLLEKLKYKKIAELPRDINMDVFAYTTDGKYSVVSALKISGGKMIASENFSLHEANLDGELALSGFITQFYLLRPPPDEIAVDRPLEDGELLRRWLGEKYGKSVRLGAPQKGIKKSLVDTAYINACDYLEKSGEYNKRKEDMTYGAIEQLKEYLSLKKTPYKIECFDISNISGVDKVASMAVFINGESAKKMYRRFKIKTVEGADDFKSMAETLRRRFLRLNGEDESFGTAPDLILIDGGKGQLSAVAEVADELNIDIEIISIAKKYEEIFMRGATDGIRLNQNSFALKLLTRLRDEAHRFAITYFRTLHGKNAFESALDGIEGIGKSRKTELIKHFKGVEKIKRATVEELMRVNKISKKIAENIAEYFKGAPS